MGEEERITGHTIYRRGAEKRWTLEVHRKHSATSKLSKSRWPSQKAAREELARLKRLDEAGVPPLGPQVPFLEVLEAWQQWYAATAGIKPKTIQTHQGAINAWIAPAHGEWGFTNHRIGSVTREEIVRLMTVMREKGRAERTIGKVYEVLGMIMAYAVDQRLVERNPFDGMVAAQRPRSKRQRTPKIFEVAQVWAIFDEIRKRRGTGFPDFSLAWLVAYYQGMRVGEIMQVRAADFDWTRGTLMRRSIKTDGIPGPRLLLGPLGPMLRDYVDSKAITGYLWPRLGGRQPNPDHVQRAAMFRAQGSTWSAIGRELGVSDVWAKQLWRSSQGQRSHPNEPASANFFRRNVWGPALKETGLEEFIARDLRNTCIVHLIDGDMTGEPWEQPAVAHHVDHDLRMTQQIYYRFRPERLTRMQANSHSLEEMSVEEAICRYRPASSQPGG